jgi:hypothetical protein
MDKQKNLIKKKKEIKNIKEKLKKKLKKLN